MSNDYSAETFRNFQFFIGVVESRDDPEELGRVKVRCYGIHSDNRSDIPIDDLPWATPIMPYTSASISGIGTSPTGPVEGTWVVGFFIDGQEMRQPMILGTLIGAPDQKSDKSKGFNDPNGIYPNLYRDTDGPLGEQRYLDETDVNRLARGDAIDKSDGVSPSGARAGEATHNVKLNNRAIQVPIATAPGTKSVKDGPPPGEDPADYFNRKYWNEPESRYGGGTGSLSSGLRIKGDKAPYNLRAVRTYGDLPTYGGVSKYPLNHVHVTETGHVFEVDDSPKAARIHQYHNSGTFYEIQPNGTRITKVVGDDYEIVLHDKNMLVSGNVNITVNQSDLRLYVSKDKPNDKGGDIYFECDGDFNLNIKGDMVTKVQGSEHKEVLTDSATQINGKQSLRITKDRITNIGGAHREDIGTVTVGSDHEQTITGNKTVMISNSSYHTAENEIQLVSLLDNTSIASGNNVNVRSVSNTNITTEDNFKVNADTKIDLDAVGNVEITTPATVDVDGTGGVDINGGDINLNS